MAWAVMKARLRGEAWIAVNLVLEREAPAALACCKISRVWEP